MKNYCRGLSQRQAFLLLAGLTLFFILPSFIKKPSTKDSRYQFIENNGSSPQEIQPEAEPQRPIMTLPPRIHNKETTSVKTKEVDLKNQEREAARGDRGEGEEKRKLETIRPAPEDSQSEAEPASKTSVPRLLDERSRATGVLSTRKNPMATGAIQATRSPASFPHPTTQKSQMLKASNFKSEPRWDFEEEYSLATGSLQTTCPHSVKVKASKSPWLQNTFLPNITLFLDSGRFTQSEWSRLEHFAPPFGFMELNRSFPQQQLLLASLPTGYFTCITCAVVGNGGILNNSRMGQEIDSHDYVFRLSGAVIKGYEQDVGTRTSFYGFTAFSLIQSILTLGSQGFQHVPLGKDVRYLHFLEGARDYEWLEAMFLNRTMAKTQLSWFRQRPLEAFRDALDLDRYLLLHPDFLRYMKNRFLRSKTLDTAHWRIYRPTTGALLLLTALHLCDKVSAYGYITEGHERFSDHYYDTSWKQLIFYINHDFMLERTVWKRLHDEGIIWLYQRPQSDDAKN
ncbi:alpha-N-acetylgalactosaminide alpha-2,6-sialyltransferase 1 isoform X2 [Mastomys coucha]|uniref:alpha-N-acetylgalactosaminide alpha-2,6-sialyltransferase 1 isoform X2 n=1 Tax=Mastomys coucha TaxID=35658 RepID=UPI001261FB45|nr:alpha-N-acetylgalactosaminide alpha-2,6-sialyltransferase 1 isoform X2 [Mastomys coucha]